MGRGQQGGHSLGIGGPKCWPGHNFSGHLQFLLLIKWEPNFLSVQGYFDVWWEITCKHWSVYITWHIIKVFPGGSDYKESACNAGDLGLIPGWGRYPGEGNGYLCQYSCLEKSMDRGAGGLQSMGSQRVGYNWVTNTFTFFHFIYYLPGKRWQESWLRQQLIGTERRRVKMRHI